jgi:uncharacterized MAPEG superfamily protein
MIPQQLFWLTATVLLTALLWVPYILQMVREIGVKAALLQVAGNVPPAAPWAQRLKKAHANAVENLVVFAPLVIVASILGIYSSLTAFLTIVYFLARLAHAVGFSLAIPGVKTVSFVIGFICQFWLALIILTWTPPGIF